MFHFYSDILILYITSHFAAVPVARSLRHMWLNAFGSVFSIFWIWLAVCVFDSYFATSPLALSLRPWGFNILKVHDFGSICPMWLQFGMNMYYFMTNRFCSLCTCISKLFTSLQILLIFNISWWPSWNLKIKYSLCQSTSMSLRESY